MKILLMGEVSAFNKNLKDGLLEIGHDVTLLANKNFRQIEGADAELYKTGNSGLKKIINVLIEPYMNISKYKDFDVVQMIRPVIFNSYINLSLVKLIRKNNDKIFLNALGNCYYLYNAYLAGIYKYYAFEGHEKIQKQYSSMSLSKILKKKSDMIIPDLVDGIIPVMYEYAEAYRKHPKIKKTIPLPVNVNSIAYRDNIVKEKIVIFHGLNDQVLKGTRNIKEALEVIKVRYKDEVEIIIDGNMPLAQYLDIINRANIIVDQCKSYGYGMNAIYSMAQGKIVLSGAEPETLEEMGVNKCPVINITPNVEDIVNKIEMVIENKKNLSQIGYESRKYVEENHNYLKIAQNYVDCWMQS